MGLKPHKGNDLLLKHLIRNNVPFTKEHLVSGEQVLKSLKINNEKVVDVIQTLIHKNIPITESTFLAVQASQMPQSFSSDLVELHQLLLDSNQNDRPLVQLIKLLEESFLAKSHSEYMLKDLKPLLAQMDRSIQIQEPEGTLTGDDAVVTNSLEGLSKDNKESAQILPEWPKGNDSLLKQQLTSNIILQQLITRSKEIGFQYEKDLVSLLNENEFKSKSEHLMGQLKPLLIEALELTLSVELMKKLETVLQRITGQQLLSTEQYGPVHQISYTLPIKLGAFETDVNIQWEAKRKENGKLDESHCRIIFYLHLLHLNEVMIDVQVQNRIISIHVFNEFEHPVPLTNSLQPFLKEALQTMNYQLSSLKWTKVSETAQQKGKKAQTVPKAVYENRLYKGVDFRV